MEHIELVIFGLLAAVVAFAVLAGLLRVPYPITLVAGGALVGFMPGVPSVELEPELVLLIFLPPLLYGAAFFTSLRDLRRNARPIALLSIGVVFATMGAVAVVAHYLIGLSWGVSFVLGAIVSPTDAVAPAEIMRRVGAPRALLAVVEGENLTNDWSALVLYKVAVAAVVTGSFSLAEATVDFVLSGVGGLAIGLLAGWIIRQIRSRLDDPPIEITISLMSGYAAYLPAEELGFSGVIAAVTVGVYMGWHTPQLTTPLTRLQGVSVWEILTFVLNAVLFLLVGLQLPSILEDLSGETAGELALWALAISATVIVVRLVWMFTVVFLIRAIDRREAMRARRSSWQTRVVIGWAGMRGSVSLAAALAVPLQIDSGAPFPERDLIVFIAFAVILATLVGQGLTLGPLINRLGVQDDGEDEREETTARLRLAEAALARLDEMAQEDWVRDDTVERVQGVYRYRSRRFTALEDGEDTSYEERADDYRRLMYELYDAQREELIGLRNGLQISDEVRRKIERDLDFEETRLGN